MVDDEKSAEKDLGVDKSGAANQKHHPQENQHPQKHTSEARQTVGEDGPENGGQEQAKGESSLGWVEISGLVTVLAASIYILGIVAYWIPIYRIYTQDISTALYATSQIPRTIIAGQGVKGFIGPWLMVTVVLLVYAWVSWSFVADFEGGPEWLAWLEKAMHKVAGPSFGLTVIAFLAPTYVAFFAGADISALESAVVAPGFPSILEFFLIWLVLSWVSAVVGLKAARLLQAGVRRGTYLFEGLLGQVLFFLRVPHVKDSGLVVKGAALCFVIAFLASLPAAALSKSPLPSVEVTKKGVPVCGDLLAHSEGFWYLFEGGETIVAVPDDEVIEVQVTNKSTNCP